jgi:hypothetical protein
MIFNVVSRGYDLAGNCGMALRIAADGEKRGPDTVAGKEFKKPRSGSRRSVIERERNGFPATVAAPAGGAKNGGGSATHGPGGSGARGREGCGAGGEQRQPGSG